MLSQQVMFIFMTWINQNIEFKCYIFVYFNTLLYCIYFFKYNTHFKMVHLKNWTDILKMITKKGKKNAFLNPIFIGQYILFSQPFKFFLHKFPFKFHYFLKFEWRKIHYTSIKDLKRLIAWTNFNFQKQRFKCFISII